MTTKTTDLPALSPVNSTELAVSNGDDMYGSVSAADIQFPNLYIVHGTSGFAQDGRARIGQVVMALGKDDPDPVILLEDPAKDSFTAYVVGRRDFAARITENEFEFQTARDPNDRDSWAGYFYDLAIPEYEQLLPVSCMAVKTSWKWVIRSLNHIIQRAIATEGSSAIVAIKFSMTQHTSRNGTKYWAPQVGPTTPDPDELDIARQVQSFARELRQNRRNENAAPSAAAVDQPSFT